MSAIEISGLNKSFGHVDALQDLTMSVRAGEVHGFLGPNGAGKSTTIRVLLGLLRADEGRVRVLGRDPWEDAAMLHAQLAYVPGDVSLWPQLSGGEAIDLLLRLRGGYDRRRRDELIERFELDPTKKGRTYSKGNRQKVAIVAALAARADLYILDEPTSGLDPLMEEVFQECLAELKAAGHTILLSSHILSEVESLCDGVTILRDGRVVDSGDLSAMRQMSTTSVTARVDRVPEELWRTAGVSDLSHVGDVLTLKAESHVLGEVMPVLARGGVHSLECRPIALEDLFMRHYSERAQA